MEILDFDVPEFHLEHLVDLVRFLLECFNDHFIFKDKKGSTAAPNQNVKPASKGVLKAKKKVRFIHILIPELASVNENYLFLA